MGLRASGLSASRRREHSALFAGATSMNWSQSSSPPPIRRIPLASLYPRPLLPASRSGPFLGQRNLFS